MTAVTPVAPYVPTNNTTQTGSTYKNGIDNNSVAGMRIADAFAPHAVATPNMTIQVDPGYIFSAPTLTETALQTTGTITAPVTNPRIDRVVGDLATGIIATITGTEAASPVPPAILAGKFPIAQIALVTSSTTITNAMISDERALASGSGSGGFGLEASIASASTTDIGTVTSHVALVTGTTTINSWGNSASQSAPVYITRFNAATPLAAGLMPNGVAYTTSAGDVMMWKFEGSSTWRMVAYSLASGRALASSGPVIVLSGSASGANLNLNLNAYVGSYAFFDVFLDFNQISMTNNVSMRMEACANGTPVSATHQWSYNRTDSSPASNSTGNNSDSAITFAELVESASAFGLAKITLIFGAAGGVKQMQSVFASSSLDTGSHARSILGSGYFSSSSTVPDGIQIFASSGNINCTYRVVGYP